MKIFGGFLVYVEKKYYICRIKLKVMWQKCPICNGVGKLEVPYIGYEICSTCDGKRIINELTGFPPAGNPIKSYEISKKADTEDFRDKGESQQEYYGK